MKSTLLLISILLGTTFNIFSQNVYPFQNEFEQAYQQYPNIPEGLLEAVSYTKTHLKDLPEHTESCLDLPEATGIFGLITDGQRYFNDTRVIVAQLANVPVSSLNNPSSEIMAYATAYNNLMVQNNVSELEFDKHEQILHLLSEIPDDGNAVNNFAMSAYTYQVFDFLLNEENQAKYGFPTYNIDLKSIYGTENYQLLSGSKVIIENERIHDQHGTQYRSVNRSADYGPALWQSTPTCNYSSRNGTAISAVTIHTIQGTYSGAISWAQNCNANVSYHYVIRSSDGQVTQMVLESDKAWHVGSENPYTIGIEHEGYVDDPSWYTVAMYNSSANVVKDITQSGYGINPLRTFQGPATTGLNTLGGCTKIKGHQHYPNQSHTDPGINWDWEYYYQLINDNPSVTTYTTSTGVFYDSGGATGNYSDDERELYLIEPTNASNVTINFDQFSLEANWDYMYVYDGNSLSANLMGVYTGTSNPGSLTSTGGAILIEFRSDCATQDTGWEISWTSTSGGSTTDITPPSTAVNISGNWQTTDFTSTFTDNDNSGGSGIKDQLYQVIHFNGTEWRANANNGFFSDNFDQTLHTDWVQQTGSWANASNVLQQTDEASSNTNLHTPLNQDNHNQYLYHFAMNIDGSGTNKRAGFHFMCDDATLTNRGNSYFVWFRTDDDKIQIYKTVNDVFTLEADIPYTLNDNQWYDIKTLYDKSSGEIQVWVDGDPAASWIDTSPYLNGNAFSLRSGNAIMKVNNLKVYHNRSASETIMVGTGNDLEYQNPNPLTSAGKVKSIVIDSALNISPVGQELVDVDWTSPQPIAYLNDGTGADINVTTTNTSLSANWPASSDQHSDIAKYWYAIGTSQGATDVVGWTDNWFDTTVTHNGLNLTAGTTYYFSVFAQNGAGLYSDTIYSDGQTVQAPTTDPVADFSISNTYVCSAEGIQVNNSSTDAQSYYWEAPGATPSTSTDTNPIFTYDSSGTYNITLIANGNGTSDTTVLTFNISVEPSPIADFSVTDSVLSINNAYVSFSNQSQNANGYVWDFGDGNYSSDVNPWHQYNATGVYQVMLIAVNGNCPNDTTFHTIQVVDDVSVHHSSRADFNVYPNPAKDQLYIQLRGEWNSTVDIYLLDSRGRRVFQKTTAPTTDQNISLNLTENYLSEGIYFIRISSSDQVVTQKIQVVK